MKINWRVRFKNGTFLAGFASLVVSFIYNVLSMLDIAPTVTQNAVIQLIDSVLTILGMVGVITDPTTKGVSDSNQAMTYVVPKE